MSWAPIGAGVDLHLAELDGRLGELRGGYVTAEREVQFAHSEARRLEGELTRAERDDLLAGEGVASAAKAQAAIAKARGRIPEATRRAEAHRQAVAAAEAEVRVYADAHRTEILAAQYQRAEAANAEVLDAIAALQGALGRRRTLVAQSIALEAVFPGVKRAPDDLPPELAKLADVLPELPVPAPIEPPREVFTDLGDGNDLVRGSDGVFRRPVFGPLPDGRKRGQAQVRAHRQLTNRRAARGRAGGLPPWQLRAHRRPLSRRQQEVRDAGDVEDALDCGGTWDKRQLASIGACCRCPAQVRCTPVEQRNVSPLKSRPGGSSRHPVNRPAAGPHGRCSRRARRTGASGHACAGAEPQCETPQQPPGRPPPNAATWARRPRLPSPPARS